MERIEQLLLGAVLAIVGMTAFPKASVAQTPREISGTRWIGADVDTLNEEFFLYNVGMGRFMIAGGGWGVQGMLLYQDFGTAMKLVKNSDGTIVIESGVENIGQSGANYLGINFPGYSSTGSFGDHNIYGPFMEAQNGGYTNYYRYTIKWEFEPVENGDSYVYNMKETISHGYNGDKTFYLGAGYGISPEGGPDVATAVVVGDTAAYTTVDEFKKTFSDGNDKSRYYQWILVPKTELKNVYLASVDMAGGLSANMTFLLKDPFFDRNNKYFGEWTKGVKSDNTGEADYRYDWANNKAQKEPWTTAVFNKIQIDKKEVGKYAYASFDGVGSVSQTFKAPATGVYEIECRGFYQGHEAQLFAAVGDDTQEAPLVNAGNQFVKCAPASDNSSTVTTENWQVAAGKALYDNEGGMYTVKLLVAASAEQDVTVGIRKAAATKSQAINSDYYYDSDFVAVDNFAVRYVGEEKSSIFVLDEDSTSADYMQKVKGKDVTVYMKRKFTLNKWNSFVSPIGITSAQAKQAFGADVKIARLVGVGGVTGEEGSIDFRTVDLTQELLAIEPGQMYIVKPTLDGTQMDVEVGMSGDSVGIVSGKMYLLGRRAVDGGTFDGGKFVITPEMGTGVGVQVDFWGTYVARDKEEGPAPGDYVFSNGDLYCLSKFAKVKGFRGWLQPRMGNDIIIFNTRDNSITKVDEIVTGNDDNKANNDVYTVDGVKVRSNASSLEGLPAGLYIYKGKKHLVK